MSNNTVTKLTQHLDSLELNHCAKREALQRKQKKECNKLIANFEHTNHQKPIKVKPRVLSASNLPLHHSNKVILKTTASIGYKGDIAKVLFVSPLRIDIYVPRIKDTT